MLPRKELPLLLIVALQRTHFILRYYFLKQKQLLFALGASAPTRKVKVWYYGSLYSAYLMQTTDIANLPQDYFDALLAAYSVGI